MRCLLALTVVLAAAAPAASAAAAPVIRTVAGSGAAGFGGDGGSALGASLNAPSGVAAGPGGVIYVADSLNDRIRRIDPGGRIATIAGTGVGGFSGDGGPASSAELFAPRGLALGPDGSIYVADTSNQRVRRIAPSGTITTIAGSGVAGYAGDGGPGVDAQLQAPLGVAVDASGAVYVADTGNDRVRRIGLDGSITTVAGVDSSGFSGDGGPAVDAELDSPAGVAVDGQGRVLIAELDNHRVRRIGTDGIITTIAGIGATYHSTGDGGPATAAGVNAPAGVAVDAAGVIYIAEKDGDRVRRIGLDGVIETVAGTGTAGFLGELASASSAHLQEPSGIAIDERGRILIADRDNQRIRRIGALPLELGTVTRAFAAARPAGPAATSLPASARRVCASFTFGDSPAPGLPVTVVFEGPGSRHLVAHPPSRAATIAACATAGSGSTLRSGRWRVSLQVAARTVRSVSIRVGSG